VVATWLAVKSGLGALPRGVTWRHIIGAGFLAGIGFTMALFIAALAFADPDRLDQAKMSVLGASVVAGAIGWMVLTFGSRARADGENAP
jgi:NhaA family Na+:H+ antiporter